MDIHRVEGRDRGDVFLYTLSTCGWCRKLKAWLDQNGVAYSYVDVDLLGAGEQEAAMAEVKRWNPQCSFPTVVLNRSRCIVGFRPDEIAGALTP